MPVEGTSERAALMAEQFGFDEVGGDGTAIDGHHRLLVSRGSRVDGARDHILADAAFALDQYRYAGACRLGCDGEGGTELRRGADDILERERGGDFFGQRAQFAIAAICERGIERGEQAFGRDRLGKIVGGPGAHGIDRDGDIIMSREDQDRQRRATGTNLADQAGWLIIRAPLVEDDRIKLHPVLRAEHRDGGFIVACKDRAPACTRRERRYQPPLRRFVVD